MKMNLLRRFLAITLLVAAFAILTIVSRGAWPLHATDGPNPTSTETDAEVTHPSSTKAQQEANRSGEMKPKMSANGHIAKLYSFWVQSGRMPQVENNTIKFMADPSRPGVSSNGVTLGDECEEGDECEIHDPDYPDAISVPGGQAE